MKITIEEDELYPYYRWYPCETDAVEVSDHDLCRWKMAEEVFRQAQKELKALYDAQPG